MAIYWTLARKEEHPAKARETDYAGGMLSDEACQGFRSPAELAASLWIRTVVRQREDPSNVWEVVQFHGDPKTEKKPDAGIDGRFLVPQALGERVSIIAWLESLRDSGDTAERAGAEKALLHYRLVRQVIAQETNQ